MFVGRQSEVSRFVEVISDPSGQAVLVVGHWGMGKSELLKKFALVSESVPGLMCHCLHYEVARTDRVDSTMSLILDNAIQASKVSEGSLAPTPRRLQQLRALLNCCGRLGDLVESLRYNPQTNVRDQFVERMKMVSGLMPADRRLIIFIDPDKEMQSDSDQSWSIVVGCLPPEIKIVFAQRPEDALASSTLFTANANVVRIPEGGLGGLDDEALDALINEYTSSLTYPPIELRAAIDRYHGHPYVTAAALELLKDGAGIEALPQDPTREKILEEQWKRVCSKGPDAIRLLESYACMAILVPDTTVERVAGLTRHTRLALMADSFLSSLIREEDGGRRVYHTALGEHIVCQCDEEARGCYLSRAITAGLRDADIGFYDKVRLFDLWQDEGVYTEESLDAFLQLIKSNEALKRHFAKNVRDAELVRRLHERGFFNSVSEPMDTGSGAQYAPWFEGAALLPVAAQIPDVVTALVKTVKTANCHVYYVLAEALCEAPYETIKELWSTVVGWLESCTWYYLPDPHIRLAGRLIENNDVTEALAFLRVVLSPLPCKNEKTANVYLKHHEAVGCFSYHELNEHVRPMVQTVEAKRPFVCVGLLEELLRKALALESDSSESDSCKRGYWRAAIEDHERNAMTSYHKDLLLVLLRDTLQYHVRVHPTDTGKLVARYLNDEWPVFRRMGLHLIGCGTDKYADLAAQQLANSELLDDITVHHEVLVLLKKAFPHISPTDQEHVVQAIEAGPDKKRTAQLAESAKGRWPDEVNVADYCRDYEARWIRTRLQVISDGLTGAHATYYEDLVKKYGLSDHPDFLSPPSKGGFVDHVPPECASGWNELPARECVDIMIAWHPQPEGHDFLKRVCPAGLAKLFKDSLSDRWEEFSPDLARLIENAQYPTYTEKLFEYLTARLQSDAEHGEQERCVLDLQFCLEVVHLATIAIRKWATVQAVGDVFEVGHPLSVCGDILRMLERLSILIEMAKPDHSDELVAVYEAMRAVAIHLCRHTDPTRDEDDPTDQQYVGFNDPMTTSINHVRPMALRELLRYAVARANVLRLKGKKWENEVEEMTALLLANDPAYSVRCVFGECWRWLYYLDEEWAKSHHGTIFPVQTPPNRYFVAAWDAYIVHAPYTNDPAYDLMRRLYLVAIDNATAGITTHTNLDSPRQLASHLAAFYWHEIEPFPSDDRENPLVYLYHLETTKLHSHLAWTLWQMCDNTDDVGICAAIWQKTKTLWQYRLGRTEPSDWNAHYAEELSWFVHFLNIKRLGIDMREVYELLSQSIQPLGMCDRNYGLRELVKYLARLSDAHVSDSVKLLHRALAAHGAHWYFKEGLIEQILTAAEGAESAVKAEACRIVHILGEHGHDWARPYLDRLRR